MKVTVYFKGGKKTGVTTINMTKVKRCYYRLNQTLILTDEEDEEHEFKIFDIQVAEEGDAYEFCIEKE